MNHSSTNSSNQKQTNPDILPGFAELGLSDHLLRALQKAEYVVPTPIQSQAIPHVLKGKDLLGSAQTGTGKTAAFALPILQNIMRKGRSKGRSEIQALVIAPTRELAAQIGENFQKYAGPNGPRQTVVFGGVSKHSQIQILRRGVEVLVATPGRLLDLMGQGEIKLDSVDTFVLDEADRMLDMGFIHDVRRITKALPKGRQTLLFSATMPKEIQDLADRTLKTPIRVAVDPISSTRGPIAQSVYLVEKSQKVGLLTKLLNDESIESALVFTRTKHGANKVTKKLLSAGFGAAAIHGNKSQTARVRALDDFKSGRIRIVVATDIAARGIDIKDLSHVINFDLPNEPESYVHRVGRTGRAGSTGIAISFCSTEERPYLRDIERLTKRKIDKVNLPEGLGRSIAEAAAAAPQEQKTSQNRRPANRNPRNSRKPGPARPARSGGGGARSGGQHRSSGSAQGQRTQSR